MQLSQAPFFLVEISILNLDKAFGDAFGIGEFAGGVLLSMILLMAVMLPFAFLRSYTAMLIMGVVELTLDIVLMWLPIWTIIVIVLLIAIGVADKFRNVFTGRF